MINIVYAGILFMALFMFIANGMNGSLTVLAMDQKFANETSSYIKERNVRLTNQR